MFWLPALRQLGPRTMLFLMAATVGLLIYLGIDATSEGLELGGELGGPFQGVGQFRYPGEGTALVDGLA